MNTELELKAFDFVKNNMRGLLINTKDPVVIIAIFEDLATNDNCWLEDDRLLNLHISHHRDNLSWEEDARFLNKVRKVCTQVIDEIDFTRDKYLLNVSLDLLALGNLKKSFANCYEYLNHLGVKFAD